MMAEVVGDHSTPIRRLLGNPKVYTLLAPALVGLGAATTIIAPMILTPTQFVTFSLAFALFQYLYEFDLGLARLIDRCFSRPDPPKALANDLIAARFVVAAFLIAVLLCAAPFIDFVFVLAGLSAVMFMLAIGPLAFHRATSNIYAFTATALVVQFGMSVPRLFGLLVGGVIGCVATIGVWYGVLAIVLNLSSLRAMTLPGWRTVMYLIGSSLPLFVYSNLWVFYLLAPRWLAAILATATQAGLFAFGANLIWLGVGVIASIAQVYYPRHLTHPDQRALRREMGALFGLSGLGVLLAIPLCRYGIAYVFPKFSDAASATAAILTAAPPVAVSAWILPIVVARSARPMIEAVAVFGGSLIGLVALMWVGNYLAGIDGQAWGCAVSAMILLGILLSLFYHHGMLARSSAVWLWAASVIVMGAGAFEWWSFFR